MLDFLIIASKKNRYGEIEKIFPKFKVTKSKDLMIRGGDFYAVWNEETHLWSPDENDAIDIIDNEIEDFYLKNKDHCAPNVSVAYMWDSDSGSIDRWHKYCQKQMRDYYKNLDEKIIFNGGIPRKTDYASHILPYDICEGDISAYDELIGTLYSEEERRKFEWAIGSIIAGESKHIQKFIVFYGSAGTGKSTVMNLIGKLFEDYCCSFVSKDLASANASFALEPFSKNPLVAIEHDGDLSRIESNTRLNSLISHEAMTVNEKFKRQYTNRFNAFLFIGSNKPVKITDAKSGLIRRLIDVSPTGNKVPVRDYNRLVAAMDFELGAIAQHCLDIFLEDPGAYDNYVSENMIGATNDFFNFVVDNYLIFSEQEEMSLTQAWKLYRVWAEDANVGYSMNKRVFKEELKNYYKEFIDHTGGKWNVYKGFDFSKFETGAQVKEDLTKELIDIPEWLQLKEQHSLLDDFLADSPAQLSTRNGTPARPWAEVTTTLKDIDTSKEHYTLCPEKLITIDFDKKNVSGEKDFMLNVEAASKWPKTYAELSKGGSGLHLEYLYSGDVKELAALFGDDVEIKTFPEGSRAALRRRVSKCNDIPIATLSGGLPKKERKPMKMVNVEQIKSVQGLRKLIQRNLNKEIHGNTTQSVSFIKKILDDAYNSDLVYDISDMRNNVLAFAAGSTHQADTCLKMVGQMKFKSATDLDTVIAKTDTESIVIFDCEVFPNVLFVNWKIYGEGKKMVHMINPSPEEVAALFKMKLVGFNCRKYDNHILYARSLGWNNEPIYDLSQRIIKAGKGELGPFFGEAYDISYMDLYDIASKKQSLKKWEIEMGVTHMELGLPWDKPVPEELWQKVSDYCDNDVISTEALYNYIPGDIIAREILAELAGGSVSNTNNSLSQRLIFGNDKNPQVQFNYRHLGEQPEGPSFTWKDVECYANGELPYKPEGKVWFPGYCFVNGKSTYRDVDGTLDEAGDEKVVGEGGYVYAVPGFYGNIRTQDVASMHPSSIIAEELFGPYYTKRFKDLKQARVHLKHYEVDKLADLFDGKLMKFFEGLTGDALKKRCKEVAAALKIVINSVYGLTSAKFKNAFRDERNIDNIVAKRGALFMIDLKNYVLSQGFKVAHIKTDSIKVPDITDEMIQKIRRFGECYGYTFETEADYEKLCLVNDAVYICKERVKDGYEWHATGKQFAVPYVFKKLFSKEEIQFEDLCETREVKNSAIYLDYNENLFEDQHDYRFVGRVGLFCPIKPGCGGAKMMRSANEIKYDAVNGTKGYRWLEAEVVKKADKVDDIDISYYEDQCDTAKETIQPYVDFDWFTSDEPYIPPEYVNGRPVYPDIVPWEMSNGGAV